jgi:hypothetical protein
MGLFLSEKEDLNVCKSAIEKKREPLVLSPLSALSIEQMEG